MTVRAMGREAGGAYDALAGIADGRAPDVGAPARCVWAYFACCAAAEQVADGQGWPLAWADAGRPMLEARISTVRARLEGLIGAAGLGHGPRRGAQFDRDPRDDRGSARPVERSVGGGGGCLPSRSCLPPWFPSDGDGPRGPPAMMLNFTYQALIMSEIKVY